MTTPAALADVGDVRQAAAMVAGLAGFTDGMQPVTGLTERTADRRAATDSVNNGASIVQKPAAQLAICPHFGI